ncbi:endoplasmic reticulum membrane protein complex subunit 10 [Monosporozyma servazzii]
MIFLNIIQAVLYLGVTSVLAIPERVTLYAQSISNPTDSIQLSQYEIDLETHNFTTVPSTIITETTDINTDELYCIKFGSDDCFSLLQLNTPLSYELIWDYEINQFSLVFNELLSNNDTNVILAVLRDSTRSELADVTKLKKITKTYADKKKEINNVIVDKEADDEVVADGKSWMEENWKKIVVGIILYNLVVYGFKQQTEVPKNKD